MGAVGAAEQAGLPSHIHFGEGLTERLAELIRADPVARDAGRPLLVVGGESQRGAVVQAGIAGLRHHFGARLRFAHRASGQLTVSHADRLTATARRQQPDLVLAFGGGSVLDAAKVVAALASIGRSVAEVAADPTLIEAVLPMVALPTTPGSGSEATRTATVWDEAGQRKLALDHADLVPRLAVVDPLASSTLPTPVLAAAALDALAHGVESGWSTSSTPESRAHALECVRLVSGNLLPALADRGNWAALSALSLGATHGGLAIATTRTTLPHALSYPLTARHGLRHGHACALMLGPVAQLNAEVTEQDCLDHRGVDFVRATMASLLEAMQADSAAEVPRLLARYLRAAGLPTLDEVASSIDLRAVIDDAQSYGRASNNPRRLGPAELMPLIDRRQAT